MNTNCWQCYENINIFAEHYFYVKIEPNITKSGIKNSAIEKNPRSVACNEPAGKLIQVGIK